MIIETSPEAITAWARSCLGHGRGESVIRLGDGEGRLLMWPDRISREMMGRHLRYWFGHDDFTDEDIGWMRARLIEAVDASYVVCFRKGAEAPFWRFPELWMREHCTHNVWSEDNDLHRFLWDRGLLDDIIDAAERVVLVTCRDVLAPFGTRYGKRTAWVRIPEEGHTGRRATDHFRHAREIAVSVAGLSGPKVLTLVGAGALGKWYCARAGQAGAVGLDIGSLFDLFAGVVSRSWIMPHLTTGRQTSILVTGDEAD